MGLLALSKKTELLSALNPFLRNGFNYRRMSFGFFMIGFRFSQEGLDEAAIREWMDFEFGRRVECVWIF